MKVWASALALIVMTGFVATAEAADANTQANVHGIVQDAGSNAVAGAEVVLLSTAGESLAKTTTAADGTYTFGCVTPGAYHLEVAAKGKFQGQKVEAPVGPNGLNVAWALDAGRPALASATATGGVCGETVAAASGAEAAASGSLLSGTNAMIVGGTVIAASAGAGIAAAAGAFDSDKPSSPSQ